MGKVIDIGRAKSSKFTNAKKTKREIVKDFFLSNPELTNEVKLILAQITAKEEECLKTIHSRFCLVKMLPIDIMDVARYVPDKDNQPNYWEYWYKWNKDDQAFLMSRLVELKDGVPTLTIAFNRELAREGE